MEPMSSEDLVHWCQRTLPDDTRAFEALVARYKQNVFASARRLLGSRADAEDVAQEVFIKIYRGIKDLSEPATLTTWIYRITTRTCFDFLDSRKRRAGVQSLTYLAGKADELPLDVDAKTATPEEKAMRTELRRCLEKTLAILDSEARGIIVLRDVEDCSYQEIADVLALGLSAVKMRIHRARLAFQRLLNQVCPGIVRPNLKRVRTQDA